MAQKDPNSDSAHLRLTPIVRLVMTFGHEMALDRIGVFDNETHERFLQLTAQAEERRNQLFKSLFAVNALLYLTTVGEDWEIPGLELPIASIPAVHEILLFYTSLIFAFACVAFVNAQCYGMLSDQMARSGLEGTHIDPDFYNASRRYTELSLKLFQTPLNTSGSDFYQAGTGFRIFGGAAYWMHALIFAPIPAAHFALVIGATAQTLGSDLDVVAKGVVVGGAAFLHAAGLMILLGTMLSFRFRPLS